MLLLAIVLMAVGVPMGVTFARAATQSAGLNWSDLVRDAAPIPLLARTIGYALMIGLIATALGIPGAWALRSARSRWVVLMAVPMLVPSYLAYAGWGLLRGPGTVLGNWLMSGPSWRTILAGRILAVGGLALWSWPLAMLVVLASVRRVDDAVLDALRLDCPSRLGRGVQMLGMIRGGIVAGVALVMLVMLGSAIPLDLAQVRTWSIHLWRLLEQVPWDERTRVWVAAWPMVLLAGVGGTVIARALTRWPKQAPPEIRSSPGAWARAATAAIWLGGVGVPLVLFALQIRQYDALGRFWTLHARAVGHSAEIAGATALVCLLIGAATWILLAGEDRWRLLAIGTTGALLASGLMPGVLVGSAVNLGWTWAGAPRWISQTGVIVVLAHVARFGFVGAVAACLLARAEPGDLRDLRRVDGADTIGGWARACLPVGAPVLVGSALVTAALSLHEIEASVMVRPAGIESLPQAMLDKLHRLRDDDLSAAALQLIGIGLGLALAAVATIWTLDRPWRKPAGPDGGM